MTKKVKYSKGPIDKAKPGELKLVNGDFLPSPAEIARNMDKIKITITLTADSIAFFKREAEKHDIQYQRLIRHVLDEYVAHHMHTGKSG